MITGLVVMQPLDMCNLNCSYCYLPGRKNPALMTAEVMEASFKAIFQSSFVNPINSFDKLTIVWHAGEPLIAGIDYYERALAMIDKHNINKIKVLPDLQSNGTLLNQEWCDFIKKAGVERDRIN
jgi:uncharacterized protein